MIGYILTSKQAEHLSGKQYTDNSYFNPTQDANGDWFIFDCEVSECTNEEFMWVKDLNKSEFIAHETEI
ncbi:MAG: hypothetical protein ACK574_01615 [Bacteroidota bacterium]|jgi:hypothetical protein